MKEKRRRAVQFSKAGLDVPQELSLFKKNCDQKGVPEDSEAAPEASPVKFIKAAKLDHSGSEQKNHSVKPVMGLGVSILEHKTKGTNDDAGIPVHQSIPEQKTEETNDDADILAHQTIKSSVPNCLAAEIDLQDKEPQQSEADGQECFNPPIVVPVSRPHEVEKARRDLPIIMMEQEIMEAIYENSVVILCGETGCGKTTQVPQFLYEAGFGTSNRADRKGIIGITQPRRVAVLATSKRVSYELGLKLGKEVGFQVRHDKKVGSKCSIKFMTDGILLREVQSDILLRRYSVIILDEAHERSLNTDILIGMLSRIIKIRKTIYADQQKEIRSGKNIIPEEMISPLKVVLMSATLQLKEFISNRRLFDVIPPAVEVPARQFPVTVHFTKRTHDDYLAQAYKKVLSIHKSLPPGGILVFVTGQREVDYLCKKLQKASKQQIGKKPERAGDEYGSRPEIDEKEIFEAYDIDRTEAEHQDGMFSSYGEDEMDDGLNVDSSDAETESEMDSDSDDEHSSQQGSARSNLILGYATAAASALSYTNPFLIQGDTSRESNQDGPDPEHMDQHERKRQKKLKAMVREARKDFSIPSSDALTISHALRSFECSKNPVEFCRDYSLHLKTMEEMSKLRKQLLRLIFHHSKFCDEFAWNFGGPEDVEQAWRSETDKKPMLNEEELLGQGICAGWADRVAKKINTFSGLSKEDRKVRAARYQSCILDDTIYLHRASSVAQIPPEFVVYSELLNTKRSYMHGVTSVKPGWLLKYASSLCTFSAPLEDPKPYYEPKNDQVLCYVSPIFSRHNWELPLHSLPIEDATSRLQVFAWALLKGDVLPCLRVVQKFLALSPSAVLGHASQRRVGDLLSRMKNGGKLINSRTSLRDKWSIYPDFLYPEIQSWIQGKYQSQFEAIWEQMHQEARLEGNELFPKRFKKVKG
uniref:Uncharacterized protein n=1 Tax=Avena sativa TaxID=4498 RepID=A0ACD5ZMV5_AVESA